MTTGPPLTDNPIKDAVVEALILYANGGLAALEAFNHRPVRLSILTTTLEGVPTMQFPDDRTVDAQITFSDRFGDNVPEPGPVTWNVSDPTLASVTPDATDDTKARVQALAGAGTFRVTATAGALSGSSEDLTIEPGAAVTEAIAVTLEPPAP